MRHHLPRVLAAAIVGAVAGAACVWLAFAVDPGLTMEMDRDLPGVVSGIYPAERHQDDTFAWTSPAAVVRLAGLDRGVPWRCSVRLRGARPAPFPQPAVDLAIDGVTLTTVTATNEYQDVEVESPRSSRAGLTLTIASAPAFVPGPSDRRALGVQVDRLSCRPAGDSLVRPPRHAIDRAAVTAAVFGVAFGLLGLTTAATLGGTILLAILQSVPFAMGTAAYTRYPGDMAWAAIWIAGGMVLVVTIIARRTPRPLSRAGRFVAAFSSGALFLELLNLLHPSKLPIDAVFHAHRLDGVLAGQYFFTQPMPDGVRFPYAIGLYLFAAPWAALTDDHVALLKIVVCVTHAIAGALLYPLVVRTWGDTLAGGAAVLLFHLVPLPFVIIGNANLTYVFGQSTAFVTLAGATLWALRPRDYWQLAGLFLLSSLAFLSHVGVFPVLLATLLAAAALYRLLGGPTLRAASRALLLVATLAAVFSIASYYGRFADVYRSLDRVRSRAAEGPASPSAGTDAVTSPAARPLHLRTAHAVALGVRDIGWSIVLLAIAGAWRLRRTGGSDRLRLLLLAGSLAYLVFLAAAVWTPVEPRFERYTDEFVSRLNYATMPVVVVLASAGAAWAWRAGLPWRMLAAALVGVAAVTGVRQWIGWLR